MPQPLSGADAHQPRAALRHPEPVVAPRAGAVAAARQPSALPGLPCGGPRHDARVDLGAGDGDYDNAARWLPALHAADGVDDLQRRQLPAVFHLQWREPSDPICVPDDAARREVGVPSTDGGARVRIQRARSQREQAPFCLGQRRAPRRRLSAPFGGPCDEEAVGEPRRLAKVGKRAAHRLAQPGRPLAAPRGRSSAARCHAHAGDAAAEDASALGWSWHRHLLRRQPDDGQQGHRAFLSWGVGELAQGCGAQLDRQE
mmetsp:Transcript_165526/g.531183  ORF Transcript_165526/g.531183 Transcript_165526/m.531183 type:complete len:258 (+) Transcript_165526:643-1416(+)